MESGIIAPGPYRATKLWNETIQLFRGGMPLKKHRLHFRTHGHCFTASEGVDCLHELLKHNHNFGPEVTRSQTVQLLKKFFKNHVIEDIKGRWGKEDFEDNNHLYRFPPSSPLKPYPKKATRLVRDLNPIFPDWNDYDVPRHGPVLVRPIILNADSWQKRHSIAIGEVPECRIIYRKEISKGTMEAIWKSMTLSKLQKILELDSLDGVLDFKLVNPKHIMYNVHHINKQGVVILENKSEELPHWVLSAMRCLANWPNGSDLNQPVYPGFERDVFKTIADYFQKLKEPLLTYEFYELFINILALSGFITLPCQTSKNEERQKEPLRIQEPLTHDTASQARLSSFISIENLMLSLARKEEFLEQAPQTLQQQSSHRALELKCSRQSFKIMNDQCVNKGHGSLSNLVHSKVHNHFIANQLRDRSISQPSLKHISTHNLDQQDVISPLMENKSDVKMNRGNSFENLRQLKDETVNPWVSTYRYCSLEDLNITVNGYKTEKYHSSFNSNTKLVFKKEKLENENLGTCLIQERKQSLCNLSSKWKDSGLVRTELNSESEDGLNHAYSGQIKERKGEHDRYNQREEYQWFKSSTKIQHYCSDQSFNQSAIDVAENASAFQSTVHCSNRLKFSSPSKVLRPWSNIQNTCLPSKRSSGSDFVNPNSFSTNPHGAALQVLLKPSSMPSILQQQHVGIEALQVCCLLLPPENRRKLQLLMKMMAQIVHNPEMPALHNAIGARMLMVQTFSRCILCSEDEVDLDELLAARLVSFMMDHYQDVLRIPDHLRVAVEEHLAHLRRVQIKYHGADADATLGSYSCHQITAEEFKVPRTSAQKSVAGLLEEIIMDKSMSVKEKKKKLKQFQKSYPDVYQNRFPTTESEALLFPEKPKLKPQLMFFAMKKSFQPFQRSRSFRM